MGGHLLTLVFLLVYNIMAFTNGRVELYITPSLDRSCPQDHCLTLSQFAASPSNYCNTGNETNISLIFLPGNHSLERELSLYGADNLSMESQDNETVVIECASQSARFVVTETTFVSVNGLHFIGCGSSTVTTVEELIVEDTIFQGVEEEGRGTALVLDEVKFAKIIRSEFYSGVNSERHYVREFIRVEVLVPFILRLEPDDLVSVGGALLTTFSSVSVTNSKFVLNTAELGGVLLAYQSNITITQCTYSHNRALIGGVMFTVDSSVTIDCSTFSNNAAEEDVSRVNITSHPSGGVMFTFGGSVNTMNSTFTNNTATKDGGVMRTYRGSFTITSSLFTHNNAERGGVYKSGEVRWPRRSLEIAH